jgi:sec-independent protein translocase protein TatA
MGLDNPIHIAFLLILLLLVFGAKRLPEMGRSLGHGMRGFKDALTGEMPDPLATTTAATTAASVSTDQPAQTPAQTAVQPTLAPAQPTLAPAQPTLAVAQAPVAGAEVQITTPQAEPEKVAV